MKGFLKRGRLYTSSHRSLPEELDAGSAEANRALEDVEIMPLEAPKKHEIVEDTYGRWHCSCGEVFTTKRKAVGHVNGTSYWAVRRGAQQKRKEGMKFYKIHLK